MYNYNEYEDEDLCTTNIQKISRTTKDTKQKNYKKERKKDFRKEKRFKKESMENSDG